MVGKMKNKRKDRNYVAKYMNEFFKSAKQIDKKHDYTRKGKKRWDSHNPVEC